MTMTYEDVTEPRYILLSNKNEAVILSKPDFNGDWWNRYFDNPEYAHAYRITGEIRFNDSVILVNEELANINGASFFLFVHKGMSKNQIKLAKRLIRHKRDAVSIIAIRYTQPAQNIKDGTQKSCRYISIYKPMQEKDKQAELSQTSYNTWDI